MTNAIDRDASHAEVLGFRVPIATVQTPQLIAACTLALVLLHGIEARPLAFVASLALLAFIVERSIILRWWFWLPIALAYTYELSLIWEDTGNHHYVICYWVWSVTVALTVPEISRNVIVRTAHILLVFVFAAAVYQKLASPSYISGEMFEMKLLRSEGFFEFAKFFGIGPDVIAAATQATDLLRDPTINVEDNKVLVPSTEKARVLGLWLTWYDLLVQVLVVIAFVIPSRLTHAIGHVSLLFFIATAYIWVQILEFGWVVTVMGLAMSRDRFPTIGAIYLGMLAVLLAYELPLGSVLNALTPQ